MKRGYRKNERNRSGKFPWLNRRRSGQGMTEYALVSVVLTTGFFVAGFEFFPAFIQAFQRYYDSFYVLINLPIP